MTPIAPVDSLEVLVLVDNVTDGLSSNAPNVQSEFMRATRRGLRAGSSRCLCCAVHGLSLLITARRDDQTHVILFDTGPEDAAFERNCARVGADLGSVEALVLSHGHWDHCGAMLLALNMIRGPRGPAPIPLYVHPGMFASRAVRLPGGSISEMDDVPSVVEFARGGADVISTAEPVSILDEMFYVSGEIPRVTDFETGFPGHLQRSADGERWEPDELIVDERWLAVDVAGKGVVVFSACSHAGAVNVMRHARQTFVDRPLHALVGGLHLAGPTESLIDPTVDALAEFELTQIAAGHCTGWRALAELRDRFGDVLCPSAVGKHYAY